MAQVEVQVPDIGDFSEVTVIELMVAVGDTIALKARSSEEEFDAVVTGQNRVEIVQGGSR